MGFNNFKKKYSDNYLHKKIVTILLPSLILGFLITIYQGYLHCMSFESLLIIFYGSSLLIIKSLEYILLKWQPQNRY